MDKILSDLKNTARSAVKKSGELLEITKMKMAVSDTKSEISSRFSSLGEKVYEARKNEGEGAEGLEEIIQSLDALHEKLAEQEAKLVELKNQKVCASCGASSDNAAAYCSKCGAKFEGEEAASAAEQE